MARRQGGTLGTFTPLSTPNAPTGLSVSEFGVVSFTAPTNTGDGAVTSYIVTAINESTGASTGATGSASPITISPGGGTFKIRAQAVNGFGPGRLTEFVTGQSILSGTALYGWGVNSSGQLGDETTESKSSPVQIGALTTWATLAGGSGNSFGITTGGALYGWGQGTNGKLGLDNTTTYSSPAQVGALTNWAQIDCGQNHTAAVKTDGTLWTWGNNDTGRLGDNTVVYKSSPIQVGALTGWAQVAAGSQHCAAVKTDGSLWTWGNNGYGKLGINLSTFYQSRSSPVQVGGLTNWSQVSIASNATHTVAVKTDGTLWTWGAGGSGKLGDNDTVNRSSPVQVGALTNWSQVAGGADHCASVKTDGTLWTWGSNSGSGALGDDTTANKSSPIQVGALTTWAKVAASRGTFAIKTDRTFWNWGYNDQGQLGDGTTVNKSSPIQVGAETLWFEIGAGQSHTHATLGVV